MQLELRTLGQRLPTLPWRQHFHLDLHFSEKDTGAMGQKMPALPGVQRATLSSLKQNFKLVICMVIFQIHIIHSLHLLIPYLCRTRYTGRENSPALVCYASRQHLFWLQSGHAFVEVRLCVCSLSEKCCCVHLQL